MIRLQGDTLEVAVTPLDNFSLEQWTFEDKADFFEHVNGVRPVLINQAGGNYGI